MRKRAVAFLALATLLVIMVPGSQEVRAHGRAGVRVFVGSVWPGPGWGPAWWWGYPYPHVPLHVYAPLPYYPEPMVVEQAAPVYVQQGPHYWYYCEPSRTYYPYVRECPGGWTEVVPPRTDGKTPATREPGR